MSGHSRWAQIRHKKAGADAKRGAVFSKLSRLITVAARDGSPDPSTNFKLRQAIEQARDAGLPKDNIERAILRASASADAARLRAVEYEAYGPGGSAFLISGLTDNPNRTTNEIKRILDEFGGRLAEAGSVSWMFKRRVVYEFTPPGGSPDALELALIDAGAEDTAAEEGAVRALVAPEASECFQKRIPGLGISPTRQFLAAIPQNLVSLPPETNTVAEKLIAALEDHQDVTEVWSTVAPSDA